MYIHIYVNKMTIYQTLNTEFILILNKRKIFFALIPYFLSQIKYISKSESQKLILKVVSITCE